MEFGKLDKDLRQLKIDFIMDHLVCISNIVDDVPGLIHNFLMETDIPTCNIIHNELINYIKDMEVYSSVDDMGRYYIARDIFNTVLLYMNERYSCGIIQDSIMKEEMKQIREYYRMIPEPTKKQFEHQISREQELQLFGVRRETEKQKVLQ